MDQIERELLRPRQQGLPSSETSGSSSSASTSGSSSSKPASKSFTGSTTGPTTPVDPKQIIPEDRLFEQQLEVIDQRTRVFEGSTKGPTTPVNPNDIVPEDEIFEYQLETDKPDGYDRPKNSSGRNGGSSKSFNGSTTGPTTKVDKNDVMPEDQVFDYKLETDKPNGNSSGKSFTGSTTGPTTKVDKGDVMPEDQVFDYKLETDKPDGNSGKSKSFTGSTTGPTTPVDTNDIMPEDRVFDYKLETDKPEPNGNSNGSSGSGSGSGSGNGSRSFAGSTTGPTTPVDPRDIMPEDRVFDYKLETDRPDTESADSSSTLAKRTTEPGRARLGSGPPVAIIRGSEEEGGGDHQVALISISHDGDYATATCVGFDAGMMVKSGMGWMVSH